MTPIEVLAKLEAMGIKTSRSTLLRFERDGLIPKPKRGSGGRAQGRFSEYPEATPNFFFAAWSLVKGEKYSVQETIYGMMMAKIMIDLKSSISRSENEKDKENCVNLFIELFNNPMFSRTTFNELEDRWTFFESDNARPELLLSRVETIKYLEACGKKNDDKIIKIAIKWHDYITISKGTATDLARLFNAEYKFASFVEKTETKIEALEALIDKDREEAREIIKALTSENEKLIKLLKKHGINPA